MVRFAITRARVAVLATACVALLPAMAGADVANPKKTITSGAAAETFRKGSLGPVAFSAVRDYNINRIKIQGSIYNGGFSAIGGRYTISQWTGSNWAVVTTKDVASVKPQGSTPVSYVFDDARDGAMYFKLDVVSGGQTRSKQYKLAAKIFLVQYRLTERKMVGWYEDESPNKLAGEEARRVAAKLNALGFETEIRTSKWTRNTGPLDVFPRTSYTTRLWFRCPNQQQPTFTTRVAAERLRASLSQLTQGAVWAKIVER